MKWEIIVTDLHDNKITGTGRMNIPSSVEEFPFYERDAEGTRFTTVLQIGMSGMPLCLVQFTGTSTTILTLKCV